MKTANEAPPQTDETCKPTKNASRFGAQRGAAERRAGGTGPLPDRDPQGPARSEAQPSEVGWSGLCPDRDHKASGPAARSEPKASEADQTRSVCVVGALGRMGECVRAALASDPTLRFASALEAPDHPGQGLELAPGLRVSSDAAAALAGCDVAIDFAIPAATLANLRAAAAAGCAYVTGTTGFSATERAEIAALATRIPVIHAPNFSLAVNVLTWLTQRAAEWLGPGYDAELVELHHAAKRDAPSGTALRLAEAVAAGRGETLAEQLVLERAGEIGARPQAAIAVQTLRGGDSAGEHTVMFLGQGERLELVHRASTRDHFARGAVRAASWLAGRAPGLYAIETVFGLK